MARRPKRRRNPSQAVLPGFDFGPSPAQLAASKRLDDIINAHAGRIGPKRAPARAAASAARRPKKPRKKKGSHMAKQHRRTPPRNAKGRFTKRGARGRRAPSKAYVRRAQTRKGVKKHLRARVSIKARRKVAGLLVLNPRTGAIMPRVLVANPRRRKSHHHRARRASNPGSALMSTAKAAVIPMAAGTAAGALAGYVDAKFLSAKPTLSVLAKVGLGILGALALRRKHASAAMGFAGGMLGATGYTYGVKFGGGHVALNGMQGLKGLADMAAEDPEVANLIAGLGDVVPDGGQMGDAAGDYNDALADEQDMGDVVED
jgi:hypothetical protein